MPGTNSSPRFASGLWTPTLTFATPGNLTVVYSLRVGSYERAGNLVFLNWKITTTTFTHTTASGSLFITGVPLNAVNISDFEAFGQGYFQGITKANYTQITPVIGANGSTLSFIGSGSGQSIAVIGAGDMPTGGTVRLNGSMVYRVS